MKIQKVWIGLVLAAFVLTIWWLNTCYFFSSDDCHYGSGWLVNPMQHVGTVANAFYLTLHDFHRPIIHFVTRSFIGCAPKWFYNICNTLMLCFLIVLTCRLAIKTWRIGLEKLFLCMALFYLILCKGESYLWGAGTFNYVWVAVWVLSFCLIREHLVGRGLSKGQAIALFIPAMLCGWSQEGLSLPVLFAVGVCCLVKKLRLSFAEWVIYFGYGIGCLLLASAEGGRVGAIAHHTPMGMLINTIKILITIKAFWLVMLSFCFVREKRAWLRENHFELLVVLGSVLMMTYCGFNGERSMWAANLFSIIILLRMWTLRRWMVFLGGLGFLGLFAAVSCYAWRLHQSFATFLNLYLDDPRHVTYHERVDCGVLNRFFHQVNYNWVATTHGVSVGWYYGSDVPPIAVPKVIYNELYRTDTFCRPENKLPFGEYYTTPEITTIVMPLQGMSCRGLDIRAQVEYGFPSGLKTRIARYLNCMVQPQPAPIDRTRVLPTDHGDYLLISKEYMADRYLKGIRLTDAAGGEIKFQ